MIKFLVLLIAVSNLIQVSLGQCTSPYTVNWGDTCLTIADKAGINFKKMILNNYYC